MEGMNSTQKHAGYCMVFKDPTFLPQYCFICTVLANNIIENFVLVRVLEKKLRSREVHSTRLCRPWPNLILTVMFLFMEIVNGR
jgi:hypothetical protein